MFLSSLLSSYHDRIEVDGKKYYLYEDVWTDYAKSSHATTFLYVALALAVVLIAIGVFVKLKKPDSFAAFVKTAAVIA